MTTTTTTATTTSVGPACSGDLGAGVCIAATSCPSLQYQGRCQGPADIQCCLIRECTVTQGPGYCKDLSMQHCTGGQFFAGSPPNWPCPWGTSIQCCVLIQNMVNGTSNSTSTSFPPFASTTSTSQSKSGLAGGQIAGIVIGVVGAITLLSLTLFMILRQKRRHDHADIGTQAQPSTHGSHDDAGGGEAVAEVSPAYPVDNGAEIKELGTDVARHELDSQTTADGERSTRFTKLSELPGSEVRTADTSPVNSRNIAHDPRGGTFLIDD